MGDETTVLWQQAEVKSPHIANAVSVIVARDIPYIPGNNRFQTLSIYLRKTPQTLKLVGTAALSLPDVKDSRCLPCWHVHIHGGAWRDPQLTSASIEAEVAHAFSADIASHPITAIASINYTLSPFPTHPTLPYDSMKDNHADPSREATHPMHIRDVLHGFAQLRAFGLADDSYILSGHSCGACLAFQAAFQSPNHWGFQLLPDPPRPAAILGLNGLYDLTGLVHELGPSHAQLQSDYAMFLGIAFGLDQNKWPLASPARFDAKEVEQRVREGLAPRLVVLDQSTEDQLVPLNQIEKLEHNLRQVPSLQVVRGYRCTGRHAAPWEEGIAIWQSIQDILRILSSTRQ